MHREAELGQLWELSSWGASAGQALARVGSALLGSLGGFKSSTFGVDTEQGMIQRPEQQWGHGGLSLDWNSCLCLAALGAGEVKDLFGQV